MKLLKFIGCFIVITCVCMIPVVLGGAVPYTSDFGWGLFASMAVSAYIIGYLVLNDTL